MIFLSLLTKELRLRFRSEKAIWVLVVYVLVLGAIGVISLIASSMNPYSRSLSTIGTPLYSLLSIIQFLLIIFITPAFTATAINSEKERQTYDLLISSQLSGFALVGGKLLAGLMNVLLLVAAAIPLFSLVFFFGGVSPVQFLIMLAVMCVTVLTFGTISLFLSALLRRPATSTAIAYVFCLFWLGLPLLLTALIWGQDMTDMMTQLSNVHPLVALFSIEPGTNWNPTGWLKLPSWVVFVCVNLLVALLIFGLTTFIVRPKFLRLGKKRVK